MLNYENRALTAEPLLIKTKGQWCYLYPDGHYEKYEKKVN